MGELVKIYLALGVTAWWMRDIGIERRWQDSVEGLPQ